jgi:hypothetical protein
MENDSNIELNTSQTLLRDPLMTRLTSCNITNEDWYYCKQQGLKFSTLLQERIAEHRAITSGAIVQNVQEERRKREVFQEKAQKLFDFLEAKGLTEEFYNND